jgi:hypothetical protein
MAELKQSPGFVTPCGDWRVMVAVFPELTIETNWGIVGSDRVKPTVLQYDIGAPEE